MIENFTHENAVKVEDGYNTGSLVGKSVLITGGASGLGEEMVRQFVKAGAFVTIGDLSSENGKAIVSELGEENVAFVRCNVNDWAEQVGMFKMAIDRSPRKQIDVVVANAGTSAEDTVWRPDSTSDEPVEPDLSILRTNLIGVFYTAKLAVHYLIRNAEDSDRCLIMTSSIGGYTDMPTLPQYNSSKWGVRGLMRSLRQTSPRFNMRVNIIAPWFVKTPLMPPEFIGWLEKCRIDFTEKADVGAAVIHIASDRSINGRAVAVASRNVSPKGYYDLRQDDFEAGDPITDLQGVLEPALDDSKS